MPSHRIEVIIGVDDSTLPADSQPKSVGLGCDFLGSIFVEIDLFVKLVYQVKCTTL